MKATTHFIHRVNSRSAKRDEVPGPERRAGITEGERLYQKAGVLA
jgi:hypothetical protein